MKSSTVIWIVVILIIVVAGVWYWSTMGATNPSAAYSNTSPASTTGPGTPVSTPSSNATVAVLGTGSTGALGTYLVAGNGMTLYRYANDKPDTSTCTGACAAIWPPYTISSSSAAQGLFGNGNDITGAIGTITRSDGTLQVTYNKMPLYFYAKDQNPGDTKGQNIAKFFVVTASATGTSSAAVPSNAAANAPIY